MIYIFVFTLSLIGVHFANRFYSSRFLFYVFSILALAPPILLAGLRADTVGSDTSFYIMPRFIDAITYKNVSFSEFEDYSQGQEFLYVLLVYSLGHLTSNSVIYLLVLHALVMVPLYIVAMKWRKSISPVFFFFIFYMTFFNDSLSIIRQSIGLSFAILAFTYFIRDKYTKFAIFTFISIGFHSSGYLSLFLTLLYYLNTRFSAKVQRRLYFIIIVIIGLSVFFLNNIIVGLINSGIIDAKYLVYTSESDTFSGGMGISNFIVKLYIVFLMFKVIMGKPSNKLVHYFFIISLLEAVLCLAALVVEPLDRLSLYPRILECLYIPYIYKNSLKQFPRGSLIRVYSKGIYFLLFAFWFWVYIHGDYAATSNYQFS